MATEKIPIGISSCLLGDKVRFDSGHKHNAYITGTLGEYFEFRPFCPEVAIGLGVPREPIRLVADKPLDQNGQVRCIGTRNVDLDVTAALRDNAHRQMYWHRALCGYIFKKDSPSCGMERVKLYINEYPTRTGTGIYADTLMKNFPHLPVEEEGRLGDSRLRENFIKRVFIYHRWTHLKHSGLNWEKLYQFHARHKLILLSHNQRLARQLGRDLSEAGGQQPLEAFEPIYFATLMRILKQIATRKNHVNVLQHLQGYLKKQITRGDKEELGETIRLYGEGLLPLIVPVTLLRHHFRVYPHAYVEDSFYLCPHPGELMLLNTV